VRFAALAASVVVAACAGSAGLGVDPDWRGAPVHVRHLGDGSVEVEYVAPTAGHAFALRDVRRVGSRADLVFAHANPTLDAVALVVTPMRVIVPADRLGDAATVAVVIAEGERSAFALVAARPR
jgi:hypothetical protein